MGWQTKEPTLREIEGHLEGVSCLPLAPKDQKRGLGRFQLIEAESKSGGLMVIILPWEQTRANRCHQERRPWIGPPFPPAHLEALRTAAPRSEGQTWCGRATSSLPGCGSRAWRCTACLPVCLHVRTHACTYWHARPPPRCLQAPSCTTADPLPLPAVGGQGGGHLLVKSQGDTGFATPDSSAAGPRGQR